MPPSASGLRPITDESPDHGIAPGLLKRYRRDEAKVRLNAMGLVVALNRFATDSDDQRGAIPTVCRAREVPCASADALGADSDRRG